MTKFTVVSYDGDTYDSISDAMHGERGVFPICDIDRDSSWREIKLIDRTLTKSLQAIDAPTAVRLAVVNDKDTVTFSFSKLCPTQGVERRRHPMQEAEQLYIELTTTDVRLSKEEINQLMLLLPTGNSTHSDVREKLHQGALAINKKR